MNMLRYMQPFHTDHTPKVFLTGNGLHRAFETQTGINYSEICQDHAFLMKNG